MLPMQEPWCPELGGQEWHKRLGPGREDPLVKATEVKHMRSAVRKKKWGCVA